MKTKRIFLLYLFSCLSIAGYSQLILTTSAETNMVCNGVGCNYSGPTILINEVMLSPSPNDGSMYGTGPGFQVGTNEGEWIELYNPDECKSIDISGYFLGNNAKDNSTDYGGGFLLPQGTIVPARGFCIVRGPLAPSVPSNLLVQNGGRTVEVVVGPPNVCLGGGQRLWFPNSGGWFAFYNNNGVVQDAIYWANQTNFCQTCPPCNPGGGTFTGTLPAFNQIPTSNITYISSSGPTSNRTFRRMPDGGPWAVNIAATGTYGNCNASCIPEPIITCVGTASVAVSGGNPPYTYAWNDGMVQTTQTATGLCAGQYTVTVTDQNGITATATATVVNHVPDVNIGNPDPVCLGTEPIDWPDVFPPSGDFTGNGMSGSSFNPTAAGLGVHAITYTYTDENECSKTVHSTISVINISGSASVTQDVLCHGENTGTASAIGTEGTEPYNYQWSTNPQQNSPNATNLSAGSYTVTISDSHGCSTTASVIINQSPALGLNLISLNESCFDYCNGTIAAEVSGGIPPYSYEWTGITSSLSSVFDLCAGNYSVLIRDSANCQKSASANIATNTFINADFSYSPDLRIAPAIINFISTGYGAQDYSWTFGDGNFGVGNPSSNTYLTSGIYQTTLLVNSGVPDFCTDSIKKIIIVRDPSKVKIPNVYTPNGDGENDFFFALSEGLESETMKIFNRWGRLVFEWNNVGAKWDGKDFNGSESAEGVYYYVFRGIGFDQATYEENGTVTLIR
ncbi:MAG: gliding motility-associated C-terminal domain-containing protein [Bacteroidales bacterium]|nr:gliding motility-associated C-terminal domain-containing protein [Bacteroidales bacterium]MDY0216052.1 gliding motility-associated C-terminal domain-containing protein [Bacteroidales bacterium]